MTSAQKAATSGKRLRIDELRRGELVNATIETIAQRGFAATTVRDIAERAGCSPAAVLYYFPKKDKLLAAAFGESDRRFQERIKAGIAGLCGLAKLEGIVELCFPANGEEEVVWGVEIDVWAFAARVQHADFREIFEAASSEWLDLLLSAVSDAVGRGELSGIGDERAWAVKLAALIDGLAVHTRVTKHLDAATARRILLTELDNGRS